MNVNKHYFVLAFLWIFMISGCSTTSINDQSLFIRIGGKEQLAVISSEVIDKMLADPKTKRSFEGVKIKHLKESITNFLCIKTGGNCDYDGDTMKKSHADAKITTAEFELMVQALRDSLDANGIGNREKNELLKILAPMKKDIVSGGV